MLGQQRLLGGLEQPGGGDPMSDTCPCPRPLQRSVGLPLPCCPLPMGGSEGHMAGVGSSPSCTSVEGRAG